LTELNGRISGEDFGVVDGSSAYRGEIATDVEALSCLVGVDSTYCDKVSSQVDDSFNMSRN